MKHLYRISLLGYGYSSIVTVVHDVKVCSDNDNLLWTCQAIAAMNSLRCSLTNLFMVIPSHNTVDKETRFVKQYKGNILRLQ